MMVTFISQCEKNALKRTRRVLDSFANRIGDNTWQTIITQEGLKAVKKLLSKTASKSTAVSCHWIRSRSRSDFLWVVGNRDRFNKEGIVPVNWTKKNILDNYKESDWKYLPLIQSLTALSALFHDWGKSTKLFQEKLKSSTKQGDPIRHEWISCMLLHAFIVQNEKSEEGWLNSLTLGEIDEEGLKKSVLGVDRQVFKNLPNSAKLIMWLIVSHHRLPSDSVKKDKIRQEWNGVESNSIDDALEYITQSWGYENRYDEEEYQKRLKQCFEFPHGLLSSSVKWKKELKKWSNRLLGSLYLLEEAMNDGSYRVVLHHARLALMLGDHYYSSRDADMAWKDTQGLFANTDPKTKVLKQKLDEHLCGVMKSALKTVYLLPAFEKEPPLVEDNRVLKKRSPTAFSWQDKAVNKLKPFMETDKRQGFFAVNIASTGCGKTFANAKVMQCIAEERDTLRYVLALGLRTLTLQTGDEYRERIGLDESELAVLIGSKAVLELHNRAKEEASEPVEDYGSESSESLLDEWIDFDSAIPEEGLATVLKKPKDKAFLYAPVLVCTIDHLMGATETKRGGKYILPSLRLMSSDLVIDEIDDFTGSDLIAIGRLIYLAGMLGRKVMISSATIPPDLAEGYFNAYKKGWQLFCKAREAKNEIVCAWIDEFKTEVSLVHSSKSMEAVENYREAHTKFVKKRVSNLKLEPVKRKVEIVDCQEEMEESEFEEEESKEKHYFSKIKSAIVQNHKLHYTVDNRTNIRVSFGVVRMANIRPCVALAKFLAKEESEDVEMKVMAYHSNQVLLLRQAQEQYLEGVLKRKEKEGEEPKAFEDEVVRSHLDRCKTKDMIFVLVATPVEEVGRDHDFDWAVIEPSSYRSIIQLAGRVRRHRVEEISNPNIALMQYNYKAFKENDEEGEAYFNYPGYEVGITLDTHDMRELVDTKALEERLDATARVMKPEKLKQKSSLSDLEHYQTQKYLTSYDGKGATSLQGYLDENWFLTAHPQYLHPFRESEPTQKVFLVYDENNRDYSFCEIEGYDNIIKREELLQINRVEIDDEMRSGLWLRRDYNTLVEEFDKSKRAISIKYGELSFGYYEGSEYEYSDQFGLVKI
ncbi:type I-F CRISPR-associated helicase Cas3 [Sulfurovum sp. bin170]|uniref:type I-F CRISPR-associated helicase Cas3f n=1 Tax=Sulfurovum sp. bin170 TaxID=2695268 RepID=UPI0013DEDD65|nr:type I-F CRISPR-associated helicase Cas3f [Sulfurovum sp. bin170]NEW61475.1 type I-F CRISPR-associated helicase Cas3 [Sulfurovum sp. bin170]